jgi:hypothetical protein
LPAENEGQCRERGGLYPTGSHSLPSTAKRFRR